jgi:hypothetical protein
MTVLAGSSSKNMKASLPQTGWDLTEYLTHQSFSSSWPPVREKSWIRACEEADIR